VKRLILDHFRRWWWILALGGALEFKLGWSMAADPASHFEFWAFQLALWTGALLLSMDLQRGVARAVAVLPLTARQIGRGWWLATVPAPAIALAALLFSGAETQFHFHPNQVFPANLLLMASLFNLLWLGSTFTTIFPTPGFFGKGWERLLTYFFAALSLVMLFGSMMFFQDMSEKPYKCALFVGMGALLTVAGWLRAERFVVGRAGFRLAAIRYKDPNGQYHAPGGYGGIPFLIRTTFVRMFLWVGAMIALMALLMQWHAQPTPRVVAIVTFAGTGSFMTCGFILVFQLLPILRQLRLLRTLPISVPRLAVVVIASVILPLIALGALATGVAGLALGPQAATPFLKSYTLILAPASLCVFFAVWRGAGAQACALLVVTLFGFQMATLRLQTFLHVPEMPFSLIGLIVAPCVLLAFLFTCGALRHGSRGYRVQANPSGNFAWGTGR